MSPRLRVLVFVAVLAALGVASAGLRLRGGPETVVPPGSALARDVEALDAFGRLPGVVLSVGEAPLVGLPGPAVGPAPLRAAVEGVAASLRGTGRYVDVRTGGEDWGVPPGVERGEDGLLQAVAGEALVLAWPGDASPAEVAADVRRAADASPLPVHAAVGGGPTSPWGDGALTSILVAAVASALLCALGLRSVRPLLGLGAVGLAGLTCGAGAGALGGAVHPLALASGLAASGAGGSAWLLLYLAGASRGVARSWRERLGQGAAALGEVEAVLRLPAAAFLGALALCAASPWPVLAAGGRVGTGALVGSLAAVGLAGPLLYALVAPAGARPSLALPRVQVPRAVGSAFTALLAVLLLAGAATVGRTDLGTGARSGLLGPAYDLPFDGVAEPATLVAEGPDPAAAQATLREAEVLVWACTGLAVQSPFGGEGGPAVEAFRSAALPAGTPGRAGAALRGVTPEAIAHAAHELGLAALPARVVSYRAVGEQVVVGLREELVVRGGLGLLGVLALLAWTFRDGVRVLASSLPAVCALLGTAGAHALTGRTLGVTDAPALLAACALSADHGLLLVLAERTPGRVYDAVRLTTSVAVLAALAAFSGAALAGQGDIRSAALTGLLATGCAAAASVFIVPAMLTLDGAIFTARQARRTVYAGVLLLQLDVLLSLAGWVTPPRLEGAPGGAGEAQLAPLDRRVGASRLVRDRGLWVGRLVGDATALGRVTRALAGDLLDADARVAGAELEARASGPLSRYAFARGLPLLAQALSRQVPAAYRTELAAGVGPAGAWGASPFGRALAWHLAADLGTLSVDSPFLACTGFAAGPTRTADGHWALGRTFDLDVSRVLDEGKAVLLVERDGAIPFLHVAVLGGAGSVSGVNAAGIAIAVFGAASDHLPRPGVPLLFLARQVLEEARDLDDVQRILVAGRGLGSASFLAVDGEHGGAAVFEVTPEDVTRLPFGADPELGDAVAVANHLRGAQHRDDAANHLRMVEGTSVARLRRMEELLDVKGGPLDEERGIRFLRDRAGPGGRRLPAGDPAAVNGDAASHAVYIDATARTLTVSTYPNLAGPFVRYSLDALRGDDLVGVVAAPAEHPERTWRIRAARELVAEARGSGDAEARLRAALRLNPGDLDASLALGTLLVGQGRTEEGRPLLLAVLDAPPARVRQVRAARAALSRAQLEAPLAP